MKNIKKETTMSYQHEIKKQNSITIAEQAFFKRQKAIKDGHADSSAKMEWLHGAMADWNYTNPTHKYFKTVAVKEYKKLFEK